MNDTDIRAASASHSLLTSESPPPAPTMSTKWGLLKGDATITLPSPMLAAQAADKEDDEDDMPMVATAAPSAALGAISTRPRPKSATSKWGAVKPSAPEPMPVVERAASSSPVKSPPASSGKWGAAKKTPAPVLGGFGAGLVARMRQNGLMESGEADNAVTNVAAQLQSAAAVSEVVTDCVLPCTR